MFFKRSFLITFLLLSHSLHSNDSLYTKNHNKSLAVAGAAAGLYVSSAALLYNAWYKDYPKSSFHFFDDIQQWNQSDKYGHVFFAYYQAKIWNKAFLWSGKSKISSAILAASISFMAQNSIEVFDGFSKQWGASYTDVIANGIGSGIFLAQELIFKKQLFQLKYSYTFQSYANPILQERSNQIFGRNYFQHMVKDYNGSVMWISTSLGDWKKEKSKLDFLGVAVGFGNGGLFGASINEWENYSGIYYNMNHIPRYRKFLIAPDIDLEKIPTNKKWLKTLFFFANGIKLPMPTLEINTLGNVEFHPFYLFQSEIKF